MYNPGELPRKKPIWLQVKTMTMKTEICNDYNDLFFFKGLSTKKYINCKTEDTLNFANLKNKYAHNDIAIRVAV